MAIILHITTGPQWEQAKQAGTYRGDTLDSEGFIHCSTPSQVVKVANVLFRGRRDLVLLCIDPGRVQAEIRYEGPEDGEQYPHIYGPLQADAVVQVLDFKPGADGQFMLPNEFDI